MKKNIFFIPHGIDTRKFNPNIKYGLIKKKFGLKNESIVLFVGVIHPKKGLEYLVEACRVIIKKYRFYKFKVIIVGNVEFRFNNYLKKLKQMILDYKLKENFIFVSNVSDRILVNYYKDCDIYVAPSYYGEGLGLPCIEAMLLVNQ